MGARVIRILTRMPELIDKEYLKSLKFGIEALPYQVKECTIKELAELMRGEFKLKYIDPKDPIKITDIIKSETIGKWFDRYKNYFGKDNVANLPLAFKEKDKYFINPDVAILDKNNELPDIVSTFDVLFAVIVDNNYYVANIIHLKGCSVNRVSFDTSEEVTVDFKAKTVIINNEEDKKLFTTVVNDVLSFKFENSSVTIGA